MPIIHAEVLSDVLFCFAQQNTVEDYINEVFGSEMWNETGAQKNGTIIRESHFPENPIELIFSGPNFNIANPLFKASRRISVYNSDYDNIDLTQIPEGYMQRCNYLPKCNYLEYDKRAPKTDWDEKAYNDYRIIIRNMFNQSGERTLIAAIAPPKTGHVHAVYELAFKNPEFLVYMSALIESLPLDFYIKTTGKGSGGIGVIKGFPVPKNAIFKERMMLNSLRLNSLTNLYSDLWMRVWKPTYCCHEWSKSDSRLPNSFINLTENWRQEYAFRTDYERRYALVEIDVLAAMSLGLSLQQLKTIYQIQFPVLAQYEADTWYDSNGRIVFTNNRSLVNIGFTRAEWENGIKEAPAGKKFYRTVTDDTMPGGPIERTIEYVAPFDRCDREKDYEIAWKFFEEKYGLIK